MERIEVKSSLLKSVGFEDGVVEVEFQSGHVYRYDGFTRETFDNMLAADSAGAFFNRHVKGGCTSCTRVDREEDRVQQAL